MKKQKNYQPKSDLVIPLLQTALLLLVINTLSFAKDNRECGCVGIDCIEKRKNVFFSYSVSSTDKVYLNNQFGDIKVSFWDKNEVKVDVVVIANANSAERAANYLGTVDIQGRKENGTVSIKTIRDECNYNYNVNRWDNDTKEEKNYLRIDYQVFMPKSNSLTLKNSFGNSSIPTFTADLKIEQSYGNLTAENISNSASDVKVSFGKAYLKNMKGSKLNVSYGELHADRVDVDYLNNSFGRINIKELGETQAKLSYSKGIIEKITESVKLKLEFSGSLRIENVGKNVKELEINSSYSPISLNMDELAVYEFDVKTSYGSFNYPSGKSVSFSRNSEDEAHRDSRYSYNSSKAYAGRVGKGNPTTRVIINSTFSDVSFR
jgi:hypothetical protein